MANTWKRTDTYPINSRIITFFICIFNEKSISLQPLTRSGCSSARLEYTSGGVWPLVRIQSPRQKSSYFYTNSFSFQALPTFIFPGYKIFLFSIHQYSEDITIIYFQNFIFQRPINKSTNTIIEYISEFSLNHILNNTYLQHSQKQ